jgi:hypothetical protein
MSQKDDGLIFCLLYFERGLLRLSFSHLTCLLELAYAYFWERHVRDTIYHIFRDNERIKQEFNHQRSLTCEGFLKLVFGIEISKIHLESGPYYYNTTKF